MSPVAVVWRSLGRQTQSDHYRTQTPKLSSPDGYRLGITPSQYCIKPTHENRVSSFTTILLTATRETNVEKAAQNAVQENWR